MVKSGNITCICDSSYVGCVHTNPCADRVEPGAYAARGPWCRECKKRRVDASGRQALNDLVAELQPRRRENPR